MAENDDSARDASAKAVIAAALTSAEREFSVAAGAGRVYPGQYLTDAAKAERIIVALEEAGFVVLRADG